MDGQLLSTNCFEGEPFFISLVGDTAPISSVNALPLEQMETESLIRWGIYLHAGLGGLPLLSGGVALVALKGKNVHRTSGKWFYYSMLASACLALVIALSPGHENPFLFSIGLFSSYFLITGYRSLRLKRNTTRLLWDKIYAFLMVLIGMGMMLYPLLLDGKINIVLLVFGAFGVISGFRDLWRFRQPELLKASWLKAHLGKMTGGYIAAVSAFLVVNQVFPGRWNWFAPSIVGSVFIAYWMRKVSVPSSELD